MAVYPNSFCLSFCNWMLNTSWQVLTPPRLALITDVYNAALAGSSVTDQVYNNFTQTTSWRLPFYEAYLQNNTPFSLPPVGTCDYWGSAPYLKRNIVSTFGTVNFSGTVTRLNDALGGVCYGQQALAARLPFIIHDDSAAYARSALGFNVSAVNNFQLTNFGTMTQNTAGYTIFVVANSANLFAINWAFYFAVNTSAAKARIGLYVNASNIWVGQGCRLDADAVGNIAANASTNAFQIVGLKIDYSTGQGKMFMNGALVSTNNALTSAGNTSNTACFTASIGSLNQANIWNGNILDCLAFQGALSDVDMVTISDWLNDLRSVY